MNQDNAMSSTGVTDIVNFKEVLVFYWLAF